MGAKLVFLRQESGWVVFQHYILKMVLDLKWRNSIIIHTPLNINSVIKCRTVIWTGQVTGYKILVKDIKWEELHGREAYVEGS